MGDEFQFDWAGLVPHVVHPIRVAVIEAIGWVGQPLSPVELTDLFDDPAISLSLVSYHVRKLATTGVIVAVERRAVRGVIQTFYSFPEAT
jgi:hypothetical protein